MRILITTPSFPPAVGGVARVAERQAEHLARRGHRVTVITGGDADVEESPTSAEDVQLIRVRVKTGRFPVYAAGDTLGLRQKEARDRYQTLLLRSTADVLISHCWQAWNTDWALDIVNRLNFPFCLYSHGTSVNDSSGRTGWLRWLRWRSYALSRMPRTLRRISLLISLDAQADRNRFYDVTLARRLGTPTAVVPNCAAPDMQLTVPWQPDGVATTYMALSVGQYSAEKNLGQVLESFLRHAPSGWTLVLCGSHRTGYLRALERRYDAVARDGLAPPVRFLTGLTQVEVMGLYKHASLFLAASKTECQPLVLLDAMAAGVPFLSTDVGCVRAFPGGMVARNNAEFDAKASALMNDPELRMRLSKAGRLAHEEKYNCAATLRQLEVVLTDTVKGARNRRD
jgi:glycosyltransferase involved in cell wall biosynthesis